MEIVLFSGPLYVPLNNVTCSRAMPPGGISVESSSVTAQLQPGITCRRRSTPAPVLRMVNT